MARCRQRQFAVECSGDDKTAAHKRFRLIAFRRRWMRRKWVDMRPAAKPLFQFVFAIGKKRIKAWFPYYGRLELIMPEAAQIYRAIQLAEFGRHLTLDESKAECKLFDMIEQLEDA